MAAGEAVRTRPLMPRSGRDAPVSRRAVLAALAVAGLGLAGCDPSKPPPETVLRTERVGPPGWVRPGGAAEPQLWVLTRQTLGDAVSATPGRHQRIDLHAFDTRSSERLWSRRLRVRAGLAATAQLEARLLGQEGDHVWLVVDGQPVRLAARDGTVRELSDTIEEAVPFLRGRLPKAADGYAFDDGLLIWVDETPRWRLHGSPLRASGYMPPSMEHLRTVRWLTQSWPGAFETAQFGVRQGSTAPPGASSEPTVALHSDLEAVDATRRTGGRVTTPDAGTREQGRPARHLRIEVPRRSRDGRPAAGGNSVSRGADVYRDGVFLVRQGTREPLVEADPPALFVLHRDAAAGDALLLDRVGTDGRAHWRAHLGLAELANRWQLDDRLVLFGPGATTAGPDAAPDLLVVVRRADGAHRRQSIQAAAISPPVDAASAAPASRR